MSPGSRQRLQPKVLLSMMMSSRPGLPPGHLGRGQPGSSAPGDGGAAQRPSTSQAARPTAPEGQLTVLSRNTRSSQGLWAVFTISSGRAHVRSAERVRCLASHEQAWPRGGDVGEGTAGVFAFPVLILCNNHCSLPVLFVYVTIGILYLLENIEIRRQLFRIFFKTTL